MSQTVREMRHERAELIDKARQLVDRAEARKRGLTDVEQREYDAHMAQIDSLGAEIERREKLLNLEAEMARSQTPGGTRIGMSRRELEKYSLLRAIGAQASRSWQGAELEREASIATAERLGMQPRGFFVPQDWLEARDLTVGTPTAGGNLVATDLQPQNFIELLRKKMILRQAGARYLGGLVGDVAIPKQTGGATAYWVAESGAPTESQQSVGQVELVPHTVGAFTDISRRLIKQSSIDAEMFVRDDLAAILAVAIDRAGLHGSGADNQPLGVAMTPGIGSVVGGTNGAAPGWTHIVDLETAVSAANADIGTLAYITNAKVRGVLKKTLLNETYGVGMVWPVNSREINGYPAHVTNQVADDLTKGTSVGVCSAIFFGNWADLIIGMWGGLDILADPYSSSATGTVRVVALQDVDVAVRHAESFSAMLDALTA